MHTASVPPAPYFLIVGQDLGFLWHQANELDDASNGNSTRPREFPMRSVVTRYWRRLRPNERLREGELELLVERWLAELVEGIATATEEPELTLLESGFLTAVRGGSVTADGQV